MSHMAREAAEAPEAVARFLEFNAKALAELGATLRRQTPSVTITAARGSSDNAAGYFKYLSEILLGIPCCSIGASVVSVYGAKLNLKNALCLTISQSGQSPDIIAFQQEARRAGALTVALVNAPDSPVARGADIFLPLHAGPELSVAATKSFIVSLAAGAAIAAHWRGDAALLAAVAGLPQVLFKASRIEWPELAALEAGQLYVLGRGPAYPIALEAALKLKETCAIHAEAQSFAEVMHGPLELVGPGFPALAFSPEDESRAEAQAAIKKLRATGARLLVVENGGLAYAPTANPLLDPISMIQTAYRAIEQLSLHKGRNPDEPLHLKKVTETL